MKWIEYDYMCNADKGITYHKKVEYNEANLAIAKVEACRGYTITEDSESNEFSPLPIGMGGTGATSASDALTKLGAAKASHTHNYAGSSSPGGAATSADKLSTGRDFKVDLGSTAAANFDGTKAATPGVSGTLPISNGGTGATTAEAARAKLGIMSTEELLSLHVWKKYDNNPEVVETEVTDLSVSNEEGTRDGSRTYNDVYYSSEINTKTGELINLVHLVSPTFSEIQVVKGKYFSAKRAGSPVFRVPSNASLTESKILYPSPGYYAARVNTAYKVVPGGNELGYAYSKNEDAYPTSGSHSDGIWYEYVKQLGG